jgi:hypothetical protein
VGRNLALPNSFFLNFTNNSSSEFTFYLFNQGGANQTQISTNQTLNTRKDIDLTIFIDSSGNVLATTTFELRASSAFGVLLKTATLSAGQNISLLNAALSPVVGTNGQTGYFSIEQQASPLQTFVDVVVGNANADYFNVLATIGLYAQLVQTTASFVTTNPLILVGGTTAYNEILNSETGNAYKIMGMDIYSNSPNQLLQGVNFGMKDANGDRNITGSDPIIDPYQPSIASIQSLDTQGFTIDSETLFYYSVDAYTFVRLSFNYVRAQLSIMKDFDQAFVQQLTMESQKLQRELNLGDRERYLLYQ